MRHYRAHRRPLRAALPPPEKSNPSQVGPDTLPYHIRAAQAHCTRTPLRCECGAVAVYLAHFTILSPWGHPLSGGLHLCAACAAACDDGVRLEKLR